MRSAADCSIAALALLFLSCSGSSPTGPAAPTPTSAPVSPQPAPVPAFTGSWSGSASDSQGLTSVSWTLSQNGSALSGTVTTQAINPDDGSCNSCHRNKRGTMTGAISGSTFTMTMQFAAGLDGDPTPACSATMTGSVSSLTGERLSGTYTGSDTCEGAFLNGTLQLDRRSASTP